MTTTHLRIGRIPFLNCVPFFAKLQESGCKGEFIDGVPSALNTMLQLGELDVSPSSSFEYARNWRDYLILPHHSIASIGAVKSVLLFSPFELHQLAGRTIYLTGESATSINLLKVIFEEFQQISNIHYSMPEASIETLIANRNSALLIGDRAMKMAASCPPDIKIYDLGALWYQATGLPFVFALWMIRRDSIAEFSEELSLLENHLEMSRRQVLADSYPFAQASAEKTGLAPGSIVDYWKMIDFRLEEEHLRGLRLFLKLSYELGLLTEEARLVFFE